MDAVRAGELVELLECVDRGGSGAEEAQALLVPRVEELRPAADVLLDAGHVAAGLRLAGSLSYFAQDAGWVDGGRQLAMHVIERAAGNDPGVSRVRAWLAVGELAFRQGDQSGAVEATRRALDGVGQGSDAEVEFRAEFNLARVAFRDADAARIFHHAERMLELADDDPGRRFGAVHMMAWAHHTAGEVVRAVELFEENVSNARVAGNRAREASELLNLAGLALSRRELAEARDRLHVAIDLVEELGSGYLLPGALTEVGQLAVLDARAEPGLRLIAAGIRQYELAGLAPDPGDDAFEQQRAAAVTELGHARSAEVIAAGRALSLAGAISLARQQLSPAIRQSTEGGQPSP